MIVWIGIAVVVVAGALLLTVFQMQQNEKKRLERQRKLNALKGEASALKETLDNLPVHYLGKESQAQLAELLITNLKEQEPLDPSDATLPPQKNAAENRVVDITQADESQPEAMCTTLEQCNAIRARIKNAQKLTKKAYEKRMLPPVKAKMLMKGCQKGFVLALVEVLMHQATQHEGSESYRQAALYLKRAISEMNNLNPDGYFNQQILALNDQAKALEEKALSKEQENDSEGLLAAGMEEMEKEEEEWKKKKF